MGPDLLGTATAANNFFREIGASLGTAVIGSVFTARLVTNLTTTLPPGSGVTTDGVTPAEVLTLPPDVRTVVVDAYASALTPLLGAMAPLFLVALVLVVLIPDLPLRTTLGRADPPLPPATAVAAPTDVSPTTRS